VFRRNESGYTSYKGWAVRGVVDNTKEIRMNPTESNTSADSGETDELQPEAEEEGINFTHFMKLLPGMFKFLRRNMKY